MEFPVDTILPKLAEALQGSNTVILSAPPGAGKTTRVPPGLLRAGTPAGRKILMLEPRRLAARRAAEFMARQLGEQTGDTVGYRIRGENRTGPRTRIEVLTEGILTRMLHHQPDLPDAGLLIFDEFHERSIHADVGLAFALDVQRHLRPDLRIVIMSATLDGLRLSSVLDAPVIESTGRLYPVETRYAEFAGDKPAEIRAADLAARVLRNEPGDLLIFLPGWREIVRADEQLRRLCPEDELLICTLHSESPAEMQTAALSPAPPGRRKIILATNIAETSLTIEGVRIVIDSGLVRVSRFDPRRGMAGLVTVAASKASADQRRGRAGRLGPGLCYRLWTEQEHRDRPEFALPEIRSADLAPLALDLIRWGDPDGAGLVFLDPPPQAGLRQARGLLHDLELIDTAGLLTPLGRSAADLPVHPRLAHMILKAAQLGSGGDACLLAALLEERDLLAGSKEKDADLESRWLEARTGRLPASQRIRQQASRLKAAAGIGSDSSTGLPHGVLLAFAYPDRIARRKEDGSYVLASGQNASLPSGSKLTRSEFLAVADADSIGSGVRILLASPLRREELMTHLPYLFIEEDDIRWNSVTEEVVARRVRRIGAAVVTETALPPVDPRIPSVLVDGIRQVGLHALPWDKESESLVRRSEWLRATGVAGTDWPDCSEAGLTDAMHDWLEPFLGGIRQRTQLARLSMGDILAARFTYDQRQRLDRLAPSHIVVPSGSRVALDYSGPAPVLAVRLQELFGLTETPRIAGGTVPLVIHLLSPARRPLAVTQDLRSFWTNVYPQIRGQMRADYPKHVWPDDPISAVPTNRTRRRTT